MPLLIPTHVDHRFRRMSSTSVCPWWGAPATPARTSGAGDEGARWGMGAEHGPSIIPTRTEPCRASASLLRCSRGFFLTADPNANSTGGSFLR